MRHLLRSAFAVRTDILLCLALALASSAAADPIVWTGPAVTFSKVGADDPALEENQDRLTDNVWITRGGAAQGGIFNIAPGQETSYDFTNHMSPFDTEWATDLVGDNGEETIAASNFAALDFTTWAVAFGGPGGSLMGNILSKNAVVHLITDDIYLDILFTQFDFNGLVAYERSSPASPPGDYNGDGTVDAADYTVWRDAMEAGAITLLSRNQSKFGPVDEDDYLFWRDNFGVTLDAGMAAAGLSTPASTPVPEPTAFVLVLAGLAAWGLNKGRKLVLRR
jgi:hypothetical protein